MKKFVSVILVLAVALVLTPATLCEASEAGPVYRYTYYPKPKCPSACVSLVDYLKYDAHETYSFDLLCSIARLNLPDCEKYTGSYAQNSVLLGLLRCGALRRSKELVADPAERSAVGDGTAETEALEPSVEPSAELADPVSRLRQLALENWEMPLKCQYLEVSGPRAFGAPRGWRDHAGLDVVPISGGESMPVTAPFSGKICEYCSNFYACTSSLAICDELSGAIVRLCEISTSFRPGQTVAKGQIVGFLTKNMDNYLSLLHIELYLGTSDGPLTQCDNREYLYLFGENAGKNYCRRSDLLPPDLFLELS